MAQMTKKLNPKTKSKQGVNFTVRPVTQTGLLRIEIPPVEIPPISVPSVDLGPVAAVLSTLADSVRRMAETQTRILEALSRQQEALSMLASADLKPNVVLPPRPSNFSVVLEKEDGETVGMRVRADSKRH